MAEISGAVRVGCPNCRARLVAEPRSFGTVAPCAACGKLFLMPIPGVPVAMIDSDPAPSSGPARPSPPVEHSAKQKSPPSDDVPVLTFAPPPALPQSQPKVSPSTANTRDQQPVPPRQDSVPHPIPQSAGATAPGPGSDHLSWSMIGSVATLPSTAVARNVRGGHRRLQDYVTGNLTTWKIVNSLYDGELHSDAAVELGIRQLAFLIPTILGILAAVASGQPGMLALMVVIAIVGQFILGGMTYRRLMEHGHWILRGTRRSAESVLTSLAYGFANGVLALLPLSPVIVGAVMIVGRASGRIDLASDNQILVGGLALFCLVMAVLFCMMALGVPLLIVSSVRHSVKPAEAWRWSCSILPGMGVLYGVLILTSIAFSVAMNLLILLMAMMVQRSYGGLILIQIVVQAIAIAWQSYMSCALVGAVALLLRRALDVNLETLPLKAPTPPQRYWQWGFVGGIQLIALLVIMFCIPGPAHSTTQTPRADTVTVSAAPSSIDSQQEIELPPDQVSVVDDHKLPSDFAYLRMTTFSDRTDLRTFGQSTTFVLVSEPSDDGWCEVILQGQRDSVTGLNGHGLRVRQRKLTFGLGIPDAWDGTMAWEPESFAAYRDQILIGIWDHAQQRLREPEPGEAEPVHKPRASTPAEPMESPTENQSESESDELPQDASPVTSLETIRLKNNAQPLIPDASGEYRWYLNSIPAESERPGLRLPPANQLDVVRQKPDLGDVFAAAVKTTAQKFTTWTGPAQESGEMNEVEIWILFESNGRPLPETVTAQIQVDHMPVISITEPVEPASFAETQSPLAWLLARRRLTESVMLRPDSEIQISVIASSPGLSIHGAGRSHIEFRAEPSLLTTASQWFPAIKASR